jgi:hypothetical protein
MAHSFLLAAGRWTLEGNWLERNARPIPVRGRAMVAWNQGDWFTMVTKLFFPGGERPEISYQYRGHLNVEKRQYTYVLQQSLLGQVEGEGSIGPEAIVQHFWVLDDPQRRSGFETFYRLDSNTYHLSSGIFAGHYLASTIEATLERQF